MIKKYKYVKIALPIVLKQEFIYKTDFEDIALIGCRVIISFHNRKSIGFIVGFINKEDLTFSEEKVLQIDEILDFKPIFTEIFLEFCKWIATYYYASLGEVLKTSLPAGMLKKSKKEIGFIKDILIDDNYAKQVLNFIKNKTPIDLKEVEKQFDKKIINTLLKLRKKEAIEIRSVIAENKVKPRKLLAIVPICNKQTALNKIPPRRTGLFKFINYISDKLNPILLKDITKLFSAKLISDAVEFGICKKEYVEIDRIPGELKKEIVANPIFKLTDEQNKAIYTVNQYIKQEIFKTFLLFGITGSGKTAVYLEILKLVLSKGKTAIVLIPEISLTFQTVERFRAVFGDKVAVLHSKLSGGERFDSWRNIEQGKYSIVIGPRSAIFAPLSNIGAIIVDEEHDTSYKQIDPPPRYNGRDVAVVRGMLEKAVVVLGSATPSLESFYNASVLNKYVLLTLGNRIPGAKPPEIHIVKFRERSGNKIFSDGVIEKFKEEIGKKNQIIVFQNRRGYASYLKCRSCGHIPTCPNCSVSLTYHLHKSELICHYCGHVERSVGICKECDSENIFMKGVGTEQIEAEIKQLFPDEKVVRMDQDSTRKKDGHEKLLEKFRKREASFLIGTQMIAKGLDFPFVTIVCIVNVDRELMFPDFRSDERAFQLITQVSGRAGRSKLSGNVYIQTYDENNVILNFAIKNNYIDFFKYEIKGRGNFAYPPFFKLLSIRFTSQDYKKLQVASNNFYALASKSIDPKIIHIYPPLDNLVSKVNNIYRITVIMKSSVRHDVGGKYMHEIIKKILSKIKLDALVKIAVDFDPSSLIM